MKNLVEVAVLYGDLKVIRAPWSGKASLKRDGVIAISVINSHAIKRQCSIEHDFYHLIWDDTGYCLTGHDGDYGFVIAAQPDNIEWKFPYILPENIIEFEGIAIPGEEYHKAKLIYGDQNGGMF